MRIASWNVNSIRQRVFAVENWLKEKQIDILLLQEIKCTEETFPYAPFEDMGYNIAIWGQKTFNGVAILSKYPLEDITKGWEPLDDPQARYIEAFTGGIRVASVYVPNGQTVGGDKYEYKMVFLNHLQSRLKVLLTYQETVLIGGDFNVAPTDDDVYDPQSWAGQILCSERERAAYQALLNVGYTDLIAFKGMKNKYTWWDYREASFRRDRGLRIDHLLLSDDAQHRFVSVDVDKIPRGLDKASDHAPVWSEIL